MTDLAKRLADALAGSPLRERLRIAGAPFLERRSADRAAAALDGPVLVGLARVLATHPGVAGFMSHRPALLERLATASRESLRERAAELATGKGWRGLDDLEAGLDEMRLLRRDETCVTACLDLGGAVPFPEVADFLSALAEAITERALALARHAVGADARDGAFAAIGMGKIAGREFTYHSDLDLIFLYQGDPEAIGRVSRIAQRTISYLTTTTGAGVAYAVDTRLRPSGQQGMLVASFHGFDTYQREQAETWEHLALLRARAIAGDIAPAQALLDDVRRAAVGGGRNPWPYLADLRRRVETERAAGPATLLSIKTGRGGLMDVDFLAGGGVLERGAGHLPAVPSVPAMLRSAAPGGASERVLADYMTLRVVQARCRWLADRAVETLDTRGDKVSLVAELCEAGLSVDALLARIESARDRVRAAFDSVVAAGTIDALAGQPSQESHLGS